MENKKKASRSVKSRRTVHCEIWETKVGQVAPVKSTADYVDFTSWDKVPLRMLASHIFSKVRH